MNPYTAIILLCSFYLFSCNNPSDKKQEQKPDNLSTPKPNNPPNRGYESKMVWSSDRVKIFGDSTLDTSKISYTANKFEPYISFEDFNVQSLFKGKPASINYKSNPIAREYRTVITETYNKEGLNFGGHYCFVYWDCGMPCLGSALVDLNDGKVYKGEFSSSGYNYRKDSRMLIINPPDSSGFYEDIIDPEYRPQIWIWNEVIKKFEQRKP